jgi:hypothetical protein
MSTTEMKELRNEAKKFIDCADERVLKMVYAMLEADAENENALSYLSPEQEALLDETMALDKKGLLEYTTLEEARARIISKK